MTPGEIKKLRERNKISLLELAAYSGLPAEFIGKIEEESIVALDSDLDRLERTIRKLSIRLPAENDD